MRKVILFFIAVMFFCITSKAQEAPNVGGIWVRNDGLTFKIVQNGNQLTIILDTKAHKHKGVMKYKGNDVFKGTLERKSVSDGCTTYLSFKLEVVSDDKIRQSEGGLDSNCDLTPSYKTENLIWTKQE